MYTLPLDMAYCISFMLHRSTLTYIPWCSFANVLNRFSSIFPIAFRSIFQVGRPYFSVLYFLKIQNFSASFKQESSLFGYFSLIVSLVPIGRRRNVQRSSQCEARELHSKVTSLQSSSSVRNTQLLCYGINLIHTSCILTKGRIVNSWENLFNCFCMSDSE